MEISSETKESVAILTLSGKLLFDGSLLSVREHVTQLLDAGIRRFIFDFSRVPHCDSSGCGEIISAYARIRKAGGEAAFTRPPERVHALWTRIRLVDVFRIFDTLPEAEDFLKQRKSDEN